MTNALESPTDYSQPARFILHPTDFSKESELAFAHALRLAMTNEAQMTLLHVDEDSSKDWDRFPSVRDTLTAWGLLEPGAKRSDVAKLGIGIEKVVADSRDVVGAITGYVLQRHIDLLVLATEGRRGLSALIHPSTGEQASRKVRVPTLFVPAKCRGCVSLETGNIEMNEVLIPVDHDPPCEAAIERGLRAVNAFGTDESKVTLLHVGPESEFPHVDIPSGHWQVVRTVRQGDPVAQIVDAAEKGRANLLIMVTKGTEGFLDILRGTTTEQVLRRAPCPVLSVPASF